MTIKQLPHIRDKTDYAKMTINVRKDLKNALAELAFADGRSLNSYVVQVLTAHIRKIQGN